MGMFDYIRCEYPLPDGWQPRELQTKDFDCEMVEHVISKEGRLMLDRGGWETVPKSERPYPNAKDGDILAWCGSIKRIPKYEDANFHGLVNFYGSDDQDKWHEYNAKFTDGQLVAIELMSDDEPAALTGGHPR